MAILWFYPYTLYSYPESFFYSICFVRLFVILYDIFVCNVCTCVCTACAVHVVCMWRTLITALSVIVKDSVCFRGWFRVTSFKVTLSLSLSHDCEVFRHVHILTVYNVDVTWSDIMSVVIIELGKQACWISALCRCKKWGIYIMFKRLYTYGVPILFRNM